MDWIGKLFGGKPAREVGGKSTRFAESDKDDDDQEQASRNVARREVVHVVLRDTMRKHGIPSDWIEGRVLSVISRDGVPGTHVQLIVRGGEERLMAYVHAFQDSFRRELVRVEPRATDWLRSLSWEFQGSAPGAGAMPDPASWSDEVPTQPGEVEPTRPGARLTQSEDDDLSRDLAALFAIRDEALRQSSDGAAADFQPTLPGSKDRPR